MTKLKHSTQEEPSSRIPRHITSRNAIAAKAGLTVEVTRHRDVDGTEAIRSTWHGTEAQFRTTGLVHRRVRFPRRTTYNADVSPGLIWGCREASVRLTAEEGGAYLLQVDDPAPREVRPHRKHGVEVLDYPDRTVYHGNQEALIAAKLVTSKDLPPKGHRNKEAGFRKATRLQPDGSLMVIVQKDETQIKAERCPAYGSLTEFRDALARRAMIAAGMVFQQAKEEQKGSRVFRVAEESLAEIVEAMRTVVMSIQDATILTKTQDTRTEEEKAADRELIAQAEADPMVRILLGWEPPRPAAGWTGERE